MNRRILFLGGAFLSAVLFFSFGMMILRQKGFAQQEKQWAYSKKALSVANTLTKRLSTVLTQAGEYTNSAAIGEFFTSQRISLFNFPENFRESVKRIRIADSSGTVLFSTAGTIDTDKHLSPEVLTLASGAINQFVVFTPDQDTFAAITRYDNPTTLQTGSQGYMLFEFSSSSILTGLSGISPVVRVENGKPLLILNNAPDTSFRNIVAFDLNSPKKSGALTGLHLSMPYLGNMVFYTGPNFYFPPILSILTLIFCLLMVFMLYLYSKSQSSQSSIPEDKMREMKSLISDINQGKTYSQQQAFDAVDSGSRFGNLPADNISEFTRSQEKSPEAPAFTFGLLDEDPVFDDEPTEWDDSTTEDISFDDTSLDNLTNDEGAPKKEVDFDSFLEPDEEKDMGMDEAMSELLSDNEDSSLMEDTSKEEVDFDSFLESDEEKDMSMDEAMSELLSDNEDSSLIEDTSKEEVDFDSFLESDEEKDMGMDEAMSELLSDNEDSSLIEDTSKEEIDFNSLLEPDEEKDMDMDMDDAVSQLLSNDEIEVSPPSEEGEASVGELAEILNFDEDTPKEDNSQSLLDIYNAHVDELTEEYEISKRAVAENREGLFLIDDTSIFGSSFQIAVEDPIFKEVLSKGKVLSLDGDLEESAYISGLISPDILENLSDLFVVPIVDDEQRVSHIVVLGRNRGSKPLSVKEHQNLFAY